MSGELASPLTNGGTGDHETLVAQLSEREHQLEEALALGNRLVEEREALEAQLEAAVAKQTAAAERHRREASGLQASLNDALDEKEALAHRATELEAQLREAHEHAARQQEEVRRMATANSALQADVQQQHERANADQRRKSVFDNDDEAQTLRSRIDRLEGELRTARANIGNLTAQHAAERDTLEQQATEARERVAALQAELDRTKRDAAAERVRLQGEIRDARHSSGSTQRGSLGPSSAPTVPRLKVEDAKTNDQLNRDYEAFSARARGTSMATLHMGDRSEPNANLSASRRSRRRFGDSDDEDSVPMQPLPSSSSHADTDNRAPPRHRGPSVVIPGDTASAPQYSGGRCPTCGRSDEYPPPAPKQKKGCPCVVM